MQKLVIEVKIHEQKARNSRKKAEVAVQENEIEFIIVEKLELLNFQSNDELQKW